MSTLSKNPLFPQNPHTNFAILGKDLYPFFQKIYQEIFFIDRNAKTELQNITQEIKDTFGSNGVWVADELPFLCYKAYYRVLMSYTSQEKYQSAFKQALNIKALVVRLTTEIDETFENKEPLLTLTSQGVLNLAKKLVNMYAQTYILYYLTKGVLGNPFILQWNTKGFKALVNALLHANTYAYDRYLEMDKVEQKTFCVNDYVKMVVSQLNNFIFKGFKAKDIQEVRSFVIYLCTFSAQHKQNSHLLSIPLSNAQVETLTVNFENVLAGVLKRLAILQPFSEWELNNQNLSSDFAFVCENGKTPMGNHLSEPLNETDDDGLFLGVSQAQRKLTAVHYGNLFKNEYYRQILRLASSQLGVNYAHTSPLREKNNRCANFVRSPFFNALSQIYNANPSQVKRVGSTNVLNALQWHFWQKIQPLHQENLLSQNAQQVDFCQLLPLTLDHTKSLCKDKNLSLEIVQNIQKGKPNTQQSLKDPNFDLHKRVANAKTLRFTKNPRLEYTYRLIGQVGLAGAFFETHKAVMGITGLPLSTNAQGQKVLDISSLPQKVSMILNLQGQALALFLPTENPIDRIDSNFDKGLGVWHSDQDTLIQNRRADKVVTFFGAIDRNLLNQWAIQRQIKAQIAEQLKNDPNQATVDLKIILPQGFGVKVSDYAPLNHQYINLLEHNFNLNSKANTESQSTAELATQRLKSILANDRAVHAHTTGETAYQDSHRQELKDFDLMLEYLFLGRTTAERYTAEVPKEVISRLKAINFNTLHDHTQTDPKSRLECEKDYRLLCRLFNIPFVLSFK